MEAMKAPAFTKDYWRYISIAAKSFPSHLPFIIWVSCVKGADVLVCKFNGEIIGGCTLTTVPLNVYRAKNLFSLAKRRSFKKLLGDRYRYLTYVVIDKKYRGKGFGLKMMMMAREKFDMKSYLTPVTAGSQNFYIKCGAAIYKTTDGETLDGLNSPVMVLK